MKIQINGTDAEGFVDTIRERWHVPGVAIGVRAGDEETFLCSGLSCVEEGSRFDEDTIVPIGSVTKSFIAHAASLLVDDGLLRWDVPITQYVKDLKFADPVIQQEATLADFLSMRTGLRAEFAGRPESAWRARPFRYQGGMAGRQSL